MEITFVIICCIAIFLMPFFEIGKCSKKKYIINMLVVTIIEILIILCLFSDFFYKQIFYEYWGVILFMYSILYIYNCFITVKRCNFNHLKKYNLIMPFLQVIKLFITCYIVMMGSAGDGLLLMWQFILPWILIMNSIQVLFLFKDKINIERGNNMKKTTVILIFIFALLINCKKENKVLEIDTQQQNTPMYSQEDTEISIINDTNDTIIISENPLIDFALKMEKLIENAPITEESFFEENGQHTKRGKNFLIYEFPGGSSQTNINIYSSDIKINGIGIGSKKENVVYQLGDNYRETGDRPGSEEGIQYYLEQFLPSHYVLSFSFDNDVLWRIHLGIYINKK